MEIVVIDGQGGGLGNAIINELKKELRDIITITALGTNKNAMNNMLKAGASKGLFEETSIISYINANSFYCLIAPIGVLCPGGLNKEVTCTIAETIFEKDCIKFIIPLKKHGFYIPGSVNLELKELIHEIVLEIKKHQFLNF
jgi:hypothetical protein